MPTMEVKLISANDTVKIRHKMLREDRDESTCLFDGDNEDSTIHLGAFIDKKLVSVASFYLENSDIYPEPVQFRLRGMATLPDYQGKGLSSALIKTSLPMIKRNQCRRIWCNARTTAKGFYKKTGFTEDSEIFNIPDVGPHIQMSFNIE